MFAPPLHLPVAGLQTGQGKMGAPHVPSGHSQGLLHAAPAFVPPLKLGDRLLVDGSLFSNLPVEPMRAAAEGPVIAVDVSGRLHPPRPPHARFPPLRRFIVGPAADWAPPITLKSEPSR